MAEPVLPGYEPDPVERFGRRMKLEYVGMTSVYVIIGFLVFAGVSSLVDSVIGGIGGFFLFLGLKKKTRDHLSGSLVLLAATAVASLAVVELGWVVPFMLFGACVCATEGYVEKRQEQSFVLPVVFLAWGWFDLSWVAALAFVAIYLTHPWAEKPGLRRRLAALVAASAIVSLAVLVWRSGGVPTSPASLLPDRVPLGQSALAAALLLALAVVVCEVVYWRRLIAPHRWAPLLFAVAAPFDVRLLAMSAMVAAVLFTATVFRLSIDSDRLRPLFKHAEWYYFWIVTAVALWVLIGR